MSVNAVLKGAVPVVVGVIVAGFILNALRDVDLFKNAVRGFDA